MPTQASSDLKLKAVKYYYKVNNYSKVCDIFECESSDSMTNGLLQPGKCLIPIENN
jgi:hypothetical protein